MIDYFHQADDPYSHLIAQLLRPLARLYGLDVRPWLVPPPDDAAAPERARLAAYARRDAPRLAAEYGLTFPEDAAPPSPEATAQAQRVLAAALKAPDFFERAVAVGEALWSGDLAGGTAAQASVDETDAALLEGDA